jgi:hypothetical protein
VNSVVQALTQNEAWVLAWQLVVWACVVYLLSLGATIFIRPSLARRFLGGFATSRALNSLEAILRLIVGLAFMAVSPDTKLPIVFFAFGAVLAVTAIPIMFFYGLHLRLKPVAVPLIERFLPLYGALAIALGAVIAWALNP